MVCLGFEPGATENERWKAQTNLVSYGGPAFALSVLQWTDYFDSLIFSDLLTNFADFEREIQNQKSKRGQFQKRMASYRSETKDIFALLDGHIMSSSVSILGEWITWKNKNDTLKLSVEWTEPMKRGEFYLKWANPGLLLFLFLVFSNKQYNFYSKSMWKMSIQYMVPGFEPMTSRAWVVTHNH